MNSTRGGRGASAAAWVVAAVAVTTSACGPSGAALFPPPLMDVSANTGGSVPADRAEALRGRARAYEQATGDFSAQVAVSMRDMARGQSFSAEGGLALRRPAGAMRLQITTVGGVTALDMLARDGSCFVRVAGRGWDRAPLDVATTSGAIANGGGGSARGLPACAVAAAMLGVDWDHATIVRDGALAVARVPVAGAPAMVTFESRDGAVREVRWFDPRGAEAVRVRFGELAADTNGARFPRVALFWRAHPAVTSTVTVVHRTVAPSLPEATFAAP